MFVPTCFLLSFYKSACQHTLNRLTARPEHLYSFYTTSVTRALNTALLMRLLRLEADGEVSPVEFFGQNIPRYAILSHTWGADNDEVTFKDLADGVGQSKSGYSKISFCGKQAAKDGLKFIWVDTCCIDKSSSAELHEAINSMFRWYTNAAKCYAFLSDVSISSSTGVNPSSQKIPTIQYSRWFTRSWTLQELLAPISIEFFSVEGQKVGDRDSLVQEIHNVTGISIRALQGSPLAQFSIDERLSWAKGRKAKREEDAAYSLLGIFDIHMPLIYGEGRQKAFIRLHREIEQSSTTIQPTRSMDEAQIGKMASSSFHSYGPGFQFNAVSGTQNNNTGSGNQVFGNFSGPVHFGSFSTAYV